MPRGRPLLRWSFSSADSGAAPPLRVVSIALTVGLSAAFLWFLLRLPWPSTWIPQSPLLFLLAFLPMFLVPLLQAMRFGYLLALRSSHCSLAFLVQLHFAERFFTPILPFRLNLPVKALLLQKGGGVEMDKGLAITVLDYLFETGITLAIAVAGAPLLIRTPIYILGLVVVGLVAAFFIVTPERIRAWSERLRARGRGRRALEFLHDLRLESGALLRDVRLLGFLPFLALSQLLLLATGVLLLASVGAAVPWTTFLVILNASVLLGNATAIPSGWGARELTLTALLGSAGVPLGSALLFSVMLRATTLLPMVFGYGFAVRLGWKGIAQKPS